jgi:isopentenyl phosphate kinase
MIFLKLGGSLITDKTQPETPRLETIERLALEIATARQREPSLKILLGHGSGSFGHHAATRFGTHRGASTADDWVGFTEVWASAQRLNRLVVDILRKAGLPALSLSPSASAVSRAGELIKLALEPAARALHAGLLPVVHGDVAVDRERGSTIVSTEKVFLYMAASLKPERILLAGSEPGVYPEYPKSDDILRVIHESVLEGLSLAGAEAQDVTGGMKGKVEAAFSLAATNPDLEVRIFSGEEPGSVLTTLLGGAPGTLIVANSP